MAISLGLVGCGEPDPEEALEQASAELARAREVLTEAEGDVDGLRTKMRELEEKLADSERVRGEAGRHVNEAEALVTERASDDVLFRAVQRRLLEDPKLADVAVTAGVASRVVTLRGVVATEALRARAVAVAKGAPGVAEVIDELQTSQPAPPAQGSD